MNRLKSVTEPDGTKEEYTFDAQGNIQTKNLTHPEGYEYTFKQNGKEYTLKDVATHEITYSYDKNNRLKFEGEYIGGSGEEYEGFIEITRYSEYDNNGNMIKRTRGGQVDEETETFEYNELNQLTKYTNPNGEETTYKYNPDGMRTSKINNGVETKYYWDRGYISAESVNDEYTASNYIGANGIFARDEAEDTDYMLKNGHGDVTSLVSEGVKDKTYDYSAYGVEKNKEEGDSNPFRYSGEYVDEESGLIYLRNRYYDPSIGRFINEDPAKDGLNWYAYCGNNPIKFVDPSGLEYGKLRDFVADYYVAFNGDVDIQFGEYDGKGFAYVTMGKYGRAFYYDGTIVDRKYDNYGNIISEDQIKIADNIDGNLYLQRSAFVTAMGMTLDGTATIKTSEPIYVSSNLAMLDFATYVEDAISFGSDVKDIYDIVGKAPTVGKAIGNGASLGALANSLKDGILSTGNYRAESVVVYSPNNSIYSFQVDTLYGIDEGTKYYQFFEKHAFLWGWIPSL